MQDLTHTARPVPGITHPLIAEIYCKKDFGLTGQGKEILVIETRQLKEANDNNGYADFDSYLIDLLGDLQDLQSQAEEQVGEIDRIDIRVH